MMVQDPSHWIRIAIPYPKPVSMLIFNDSGPNSNDLCVFSMILYISGGYPLSQEVPERDFKPAGHIITPRSLFWICFVKKNVFLLI